MSNTDNSKATTAAIKNSAAVWEKFLYACKICGGAIIITLILMAIFLA